MKNQSSLLRWAGVCSLILVAFVSFGHVAQSATESKRIKGEGHADLISIDTMAIEGELQLPAVLFQHDKHTSALAADKAVDCGTCHNAAASGKPGEFSFKFKDAEGLKGTALKEMFHTNCIGCHTQRASSGQSTGPLEADCRSCHNPRPAVVSSWNDIGFDKVVHYKHASSPFITFAGDPKLNCGACHHVYDAKAEKLVWGKDKEDSCRACHFSAAELQQKLAADPKAQDENGFLAKRQPLGVAAHNKCINCHLSLAKSAPQEKTGPVSCAGCHGPAEQAKLQEQAADPTIAGSIPRLMRGQPDAVLMLPTPQEGTKLESAMRPVSFNHKFHESVVMDCRSCHHKKITSCSSCHSIEGKKEGDFIPLAKAMHKVDATRSCVGCHAVQQSKPSCAGCHSTPPTHLNPNSCGQCHTTPVGVAVEDAENGSLLKLTKEERTALATATVAERDNVRTRTFDLADIPEKVTIGSLSKEYEPSVLPHRAIVATLLKKQADSQLAGVFHPDKGTLCQGCHHNSPPSKTPPRCVSCHGASVQAVDGRPGLKAAYHLQCMTCHAAMNQKPLANDCNSCHKPRAQK